MLPAWLSNTRGARLKLWLRWEPGCHSRQIQSIAARGQGIAQGFCSYSHLARGINTFSQSKSLAIGSTVPVARDLFEVRQALRKKRLHHANLPGSFDGCDVD